MGMNRLPFALICDRDFSMPTVVTITSILENKAEDTFADIYVFGGDFSIEDCKKFDVFEDYKNCKVTCIPKSLDKFNDIVQMSSISPACLLKFELCDELSEYDRVLYVDTDMIIREDLWNLYSTAELGDNYLGAVLHSSCIMDKTERINGGFLLFNARKMRDDHMSEKLLAYRRSLGNRRSMDQQTFNEYCKGQITFLPIRYNCMPFRYIDEQIPQYYTMAEFNEFFGTNYRSWKDAVKDAAVIHYITGEKPWKSYDIYAGEEWYKYYLKSPYKDVPLKRTGKGARFAKLMRKEGMSGVLERYIKRPLRSVYYTVRGLEFRKKKWASNNWG
ncbi:hypothetical protein NXH67_15705 [Butyrivibrio sp. DSM 10294]|uniref:glycosyltransferase family 8 protein n=1 Tax=Butyrivibrio sp. DSM 10294 TaxID=2972457 RepID=UPI00234E6794|nr:glycosyltransferase [Butyrivibrio sp. DSM 10294]MDC7294956.1 hypothetical protein [Butyrivibrio sp. DSM 10294]